MLAASPAPMHIYFRLRILPDKLRNLFNLYQNHHSLSANFSIETKEYLETKGHNITTVTREGQYLAVLSAGYKLAKELDGTGDSRKEGDSSII